MRRSEKPRGRSSSSASVRRPQEWDPGWSQRTVVGRSVMWRRDPRLALEQSEMLGARSRLRGEADAAKDSGRHEYLLAGGS